MNNGFLKKKVILILSFIIILSSIRIPASAEGTSKILIKIGSSFMWVDDVKKEIDPGKNTSAMIINSRTLLPIRAIVEEMGGTISWDQKEKRVGIQLGNVDMKLWINKKEAILNGKDILIDVSPIIYNDRTMLPLRFVTENLGADLEWDNVKKEALIKFNKVQNQHEEPGKGPDKDSNSYIPPRKPAFYMRHQFELIGNNMGRVYFERDFNYKLGEYTGFKLYYTDGNNKYQVLDFDDNGFYYDEEIGNTVDLRITAVNRTAESDPVDISFAMLNNVKGDIIWSERQTEDLFGSPCWYGASWQPLEGAVRYEVYVTNDIINYTNFKFHRDLSGFSGITVTEPNFSTKTNTGLPSELVNATWGTSRYIVIFPVNKDDITGPFPKYYEIIMTGISTKTTN